MKPAAPSPFIIADKRRESHKARNSLRAERPPPATRWLDEKFRDGNDRLCGKVAFVSEIWREGGKSGAGWMNTKGGSRKGKHGEKVGSWI